MHSAYRISSSFSVASRTRIPLSISSLSLSIHFSLPTHPETKLEFFNNFLMVTFSIFSFLIASNFAFRASSLAILFWSRDSFCCFFCAFLSSFDFFAKLENLLFSSYSLKPGVATDKLKKRHFIAFVAFLSLFWVAIKTKKSF